ncbi:uncharacterized protein OCT59_002419 [Rhizophagus irregularis]|uniref:uncharacterized protein n=1 Tax=Rhizophagus irregularis TaxID=588596 RepID=UPI000CA932B4|nr:hypothetical protein OCT59_002419 [Rhizophagus irregularis]GBC18097.2 sensor histidine kinase/response regulator, putative [Rhizophagus irregularis DAOM 181602=DAOM 197198]
MIVVEPRDARWWVMAEDGALKQLLMNIIENSMKFTKKGYVLISLASLSYSLLSDQYKKHAGVQDTTTTDTSSSNNIHALITITDTECGISPSFLSTKMFRPLSQENTLQVDPDQANEEISRDIKNDDLGNFNSLDSFNENDNLIKDFEEKQRKILLSIILKEVKQKRVVVKCVDGKLKEIVESNLI